MTRSPKARRGRARLVLAAVLLVAGGAALGVTAVLVNQDDEPAGTDLSGIQASIAALPRCADVFKPGQVIDQAKVAGGCLDPDGGVQFSGSSRCGDGRYLWQVDAATGATAGFGFSGSPYVASKDAARDPAYAKANETCNS